MTANILEKEVCKQKTQKKPYLITFLTNEDCAVPRNIDLRKEECPDHDFKSTVEWAKELYGKDNVIYHNSLGRPFFNHNMTASIYVRGETSSDLSLFRYKRGENS